MKRLLGVFIFISTIVLCISVTGTRGFAANGLFTDADAEANAYITSLDRKPGTREVVRSRHVTVNLHLLDGSDSRKETEPVSLNLFDDVFFAAKNDRVERRSETQYTWF